MPYPDNVVSHIARQNIAVIQCTYDAKGMVDRTLAMADTSIKYPAAPEVSLDPVTTRIDIGDLVFYSSTSKIPRQNMLGSAVPALSCLNGLNVAKVKQITNNIDQNDEAACNEAVKETIHVLGVALAVAQFDPNNNLNTKTQFTCMTNGTFTIKNNGEHRIAPGDKLTWDVPTIKNINDAEFRKNAHEKGKSDKKVALKIVPLSIAQSSYTSAVLHALTDIKGTNKHLEMNINSAEYGKAMRDVILTTLFSYAQTLDNTITFDQFIDTPATQNAINAMCANGSLKRAVDKSISATAKVVDDLNSRTFATAVGYSKPGQTCDVFIAI